MDMPIEFVDETKNHSGKWYEVCTFCSMDENEKPEIIARFLYSFDAVKFAKIYTAYAAGIHTVLIR